MEPLILDRIPASASRDVAKPVPLAGAPTASAVTPATMTAPSRRRRTGACAAAAAAVLAAFAWLAILGAMLPAPRHPTAGVAKRDAPANVEVARGRVVAPGN